MFVRVNFCVVEEEADSDGWIPAAELRDVSARCAGNHSSLIVFIRPSIATAESRCPLAPGHHFISSLPFPSLVPPILPPSAISNKIYLFHAITGYLFLNILNHPVF
ncbi:uncharacterized [Tachysurus ichikawai]